jgi:hypothetical protein
VEIIDNFLEEKDVEFVLKYCFTSSYTYGETDNEITPPTGMVHNIKNNETIYNLFELKIRDSYDIVKGMNLYRMYINCFAPSENPYFHVDGNGLTFLYYVSDYDWQYNDGGETQFLIDDEIKGVLPIPNRMVGFDANLLHRATSFRNHHRFTIAIKFSS